MSLRTTRFEDISTSHGERKQALRAIQKDRQGRESAMRKILYRKMTSKKDSRKLMSIIERSSDKECATCVRKNFLYVINRVDEIEKDLPAPEMHIRKACNSRTKVEMFKFKVQGSFYIVHGDQHYKVNFCHHLHIQLNWKTKNFSPKPVTLT